MNETLTGGGFWAAVFFGVLVLALVLRKLEIPYMDLAEQVDKDFGRIRRKAYLRRLVIRLSGKPVVAELLAFEEARKSLSSRTRVYRGRSVVPVCKIVGSVGRYRDFDCDFSPRPGVAARWKRVDLAFHRGVELPPVCLYKLGEEYFVHDGNHRISVARFQGVEAVEAEVTEFFAQPRKTRRPAANRS